MVASIIENPTPEIIARVSASPKVRNILVAGPKGVGKTHMGFEVGAWLAKHFKDKNYPVQKVQCQPEGSPAEALGMFVPAGDKFDWLPGPIDVAYHGGKGGGLLILDELAEASGPLKTFLYGALDTGPGGVISYVGRTFRAGPNYKVWATMNGYPYEGALPEPLLDRFDAVFCVFKPGPKQLALLEPDLRDVCEVLYDTAKDPMLGPDITFRNIMSIQTLRQIIPLEQAVLSACRGNKTLAGSLLEVLALADEADEDGVTADYTDSGDDEPDDGDDDDDEEELDLDDGDD